MEQLLLVLAAAALVVWIVSDRSRNPLTRCPKCGGKGTLPSRFFKDRYRPCGRCGRSGEIRRGKDT